jgi:hypothetical protein
MTNGQITKRILTACKKLTGKALQSHCETLLRSFPLSSHKLVYDCDKDKVPAAAWKVLIAACKVTDERKLRSKNSWLEDMGAGDDMLDKTFGRFAG